MNQKNFLILERSSQNLKKISDKGKTVLEGIFAEFGVENRNGRVYEEKEYLPHLEYLKKDVTSGNLLGELDHPERFEVALGNVSHRVTELWYDQASRQIKGRIEVLDTPKGQIAKSLLEAGIPLSISSRAAGTVNEDKTVSIQQIYTYDLVAKPGFENAQLSTVSESMKVRIEKQMQILNESNTRFEANNILAKLGIVNENITMIDLTDKYPSVKLREEAKVIKNKDENMGEINEDVLQQWTVFFKKELSKINEKLGTLEESMVSGKGDNASKEIKDLKKYVEKIRSIQENAINWQGDIAKAVNKVAGYANTIAEKSNNHYKITKKINETVDWNAEVLNKTQDWVGSNAEKENELLEAFENWNTQMAKAINELHEWGSEKARAINSMYEWSQEKARAINDMHEWTSSIAKNVNGVANWSEDMFGRAMSKRDAKKLVEWIELVSEGKENSELKKRLDETLQANGVTGKPINESMITGITGVPGLGVITDAKGPKPAAYTDPGKDTGIFFDEKTGTIQTKTKPSKIKKNSTQGIKTIGSIEKKVTIGKNKVKGVMVLDTVKVGKKPSVQVTQKPKGDQNLKLDHKPESHLKESLSKGISIKERSTKLDEKLNKIISRIEKEKVLLEGVVNKYPFVSLLGETDKKQFAGLSESDKKKVAGEVAKNPTTDSRVIKGLWKSALVEGKIDEPLWLKLAPKQYKEAYNKAPDQVQESIQAHAEFYLLETQYQINHFWENSKLVTKPIPSINEVFTTKRVNPEKMDEFVSFIGEQMKKYN